MRVRATRTGANAGPYSDEAMDAPEAAGVTVSETALTVTEEDTTGDSYTVVLDSQPTANVVVTVAGHSGTDVLPAPTTLTFTSMNWETAQTVTVTAVNDADTTNDTVSLTHSAASTDTDYDGITIAGVPVTVEDNDTAKVTGVMLTPGDGELAVAWVPLANATGYEVQWKSGGQSYNTSDRQATIASGSTASHTISSLTNGTTYTVRVRATRTDANAGPYSDEAMDAPQAAGVTVSETALTVTEEDTTGDSYTVVLDSQPTANVVVTVAGHSGTDVLPAPTTLTFTSMNWETAQTVTVTAVNDADTTNDTVSLTHAAASTDTDYDGITIAGVTVTVEDNDTAKVTGVMLTPGDGELAVAWVALANATGYEVQWKSGGQSYNTSGRQATIGSGSTASHTIPSLTNGTTYTVRVRATRTGANAGPYSDEAMDAPEAPGVTVSETALTVTEQDTTGDSYTVVLDSQPTANVVVTVAGHSGTDVLPAPTTLTFTSMNWETAQTVTVTAGNDADTVNDEVDLTHTATSTDTDYSGITIAGVAVTVNDDDTANTAPTFGSTTANRSVAENTAAGQNVGVVLTATDDDGDTLTYTLEGADAASFDLVTTTDPAAQIRTKSGVTYDHEAKSTYTVVVKADDGNSGTDTVTVTISITDVDEAPGRPAAPTVVTVTGAPTFLSVDWLEPPTNTGPDIDTYDLRYQKTTESTWTNGPQDETGDGLGGTAVIMGLDAGTAYRVQVRATNAEGDSQWSPSGTGTTETPGTSTLSFAGANITVNETAGSATLTVELDPASTGTVTVGYATSNLTAQAGVDYTATSGTLTFAASETSKTITVPILNDTDYDPAQRFHVTLNNASGATLPASPWAIVNITNDDAAPTASIANVTVGEGAGTMTLTLALDRLSNRDVDYFSGASDVSGTATVADDYVDFFSRLFTVPAGAMSATFDITLVDDSLDETDETIVIVWRKDSGSQATPASITVTGTITDNDTAGNNPPVFDDGDDTSRAFDETLGDAAVMTASDIGTPVGATDSNNDTLTYSLEGADAARFGIARTTGQLQTMAGEKYDFEAQSSYEVSISVVDGNGGADTIDVTVNVNNMTETPLAPDAPTVTTTPGSMTGLAVNWTEPNNSGRPAITGYDLHYRAGTSGGWTDGPQGVTGTSASITGLTQDTSYQVQVRALNTDGNGDWSSSGSARTGAPPTPTVRFGATSYTAIEGVGGATVTVALSVAASRSVTVRLTKTHLGGATAADYTGVPSSVTFAAGETEQTFIVTAVDDTADDDGESLQLGFDTLPSGVLLGSPSTATVALVQDADVSTWYVWFGESSYTATEGGSAEISVHLNSPWKPELNEALTVPLFDPQHRGGASADDYSGLPESVTFRPGQTRTSFTMRATEDSEDDDGESVLIQFRRWSQADLEGGRYGPHNTTLHIADNDGEKAVTVSFDAANYTAAEGGATATVRLRLDAAPGRSVTIDLTKTHRGATAADYSGLPGSVTFGASETAKSFTLTATDDSADDDLESVAIGFGSLPSKVSAGSPSQAVVNLTDNDGGEEMLTVRFDASAGAVRDGVEEGGSYSLGFRLDRKPGRKLTIPLTYTYLGGATEADFEDLPTDVTFEEDKSWERVTLRVVDDFEEDPGESLEVSFGTLPAGVKVSSLSGPSTIIPVIDNDAPPGLSVSDASAREWPNTKVCLNFVVTMDRMDVDHEVSVDYATASGTAVAGQDFTPISGTLVFRPFESERRTATKNLCVEVIDDSHDEGVEEMTLVLSNPVRAYLADETGIGCISNTDKMPGAWLTRFGRAATDHVVEAVGERWQGGPQTSHLTLGGRQVGDLFGWAGLGGRTGLGGRSGLDGRSGRDTTVDRDDPVGTDPSSKGWLAPSGGAGADIGATAPGMTLSLGDMNTAPGGPGGVEREAGKTLSGRAAQGALLRALGLPDPRAVPDFRTLLMGSSFFYSAALDEDGESRSPGRSRSPGWLGEWSAWGRTAASRFSGADGNLTLDGEVATAMLGFDSRWDRWLAGVVVSFSEGRGAYTHPTASGGAVATTMTGLNPYARFELNERTSFWGVLGYGVGDLSLTPARSDTALGTELANAMAAFGGRTALSVRTGEAGRFELALRSDARLTNTVSESIEGLVGTAGRTGRVRLMLEGSGSMPLATGAVLKPKLEAGLRYDTGDAETGAGLEVGGGLGYAAGRLSVEVNARGLLAHRDTEYEEWGFSGSIAYTPSKDGRGLSMRLGSAWGATQSGVQSLWSRQDASGLVRNGVFEAAQRYQVELRYGLDGKKGRTRWEPFVGVESGEGASRALRLGVKLTSGRHLDAALELGQRQGRPGADPEQSVQLRGVLRW